MLPNKLQHGDSFARMFDLYNQLIDHLRETRLVAGPGVSISRLPSGTVINAGRKSSAPAPAPAAADQGGPFAVEIVDLGNSSGQRVVLCNSDSHSGIAGVVYAGSHRETVSDMEWQPRAGVLFLDVTYNEKADDYVIEFKLESELPDSALRRYVLRIAEITYDSETKTYSAHQVRSCGDIEITGRWVK